MNQGKPSFVARGSVFSPLLVIFLDLLICRFLPDTQIATPTSYYPILLMILAAVFLAMISLSYRRKDLNKNLKNKVPIITAAFFLAGIWDIVTSKLNLLPLPYFPGPEKVLSALGGDWQQLGISTLFSLRLLFTGYFLGAFIGLATGIYIGWSQKGNYWVGPLIKIIGPIPATAWIPISMVIFPTSFWASVFLITLAVWFPVTVMTSSGIANVKNAYFEVAKTLGSTQKYLIFRVAVPASAPTIFIGLFMGLGASFLTIIVAEMLGVKAGLGWYINWAQGWAEYSKVYASLAVIALLFFGIITLLFKIKDRMLVWQRGLIKW